MNYLFLFNDRTGAGDDICIETQTKSQARECLKDIVDNPNDYDCTWVAEATEENYMITDSWGLDIY